MNRPQYPLHTGAGLIVARRVINCSAIKHGRTVDENAIKHCPKHGDPITAIHSSSSSERIYMFIVQDSLKGRPPKGSPYSITERRVPELIPVLGSQPAGDVSHKPGGRLSLLSARPAVTLATLRELLPVSLFGEQRHDGCEQFA